MMAAEGAGVDCVKFQLRDAEYEFSGDELARKYDGRNSFGATYGEHRAAIDLEPHDIAHLRDRHRYNKCRSRFGVTPTSPSMVRFLYDIVRPDFIKIAAKDCRNEDIQRQLIKYRDSDVGPREIPWIVSVNDPDSAYYVSTWMSANDRICYATPHYPTHRSRANMRLVDHPHVSGFSDHTVGNAAAVLAIARGVPYVEKHITFDCTQKGTDHACSITPKEFGDLVYWRDHCKELLYGVG